MADSPPEEVEVRVPSYDEAEQLFQRMTRWVEQVEPMEPGGTIQRNRRPEVWAYVSGLALVSEAISMGLAVTKAAFEPTLGFALAGLILAVASIALHQRSWRMP